MASDQSSQMVKVTVEQALQNRREDLLQFLGDSRVMERFIKVSTFAISSNPQLRECTPESLVLSVMKLAEVGLEPGGVLAEAHLVPYRNKAGKLEAQPIPDYKGLVRVARESESLLDVKAVVVHANDVFEWNEGSDPSLIHRPNLKNPGDPIAGYSMALLKGDVRTWLVMSKAEIMKVKASSRAASSGPWVQWEEEMWKKTALKRHSKVLPRRGKFLTALALEDQAEEGGADWDAPEEIPASRVEEVKNRASRGKKAPTPEPEPEDAQLVSEPPDDVLLPGMPGYVPGQPAPVTSRMPIIDVQAGESEQDAKRRTKSV